MATTVSVATFNLWCGGERAHKDPAVSRDLVVAAAAALDADVLCVQEHNGFGEELARRLRYNVVIQDASTAILTRLQVAETTPKLWGARLTTAAGPSQRSVWVFNAHFPHYPYGPYQLAGIPYMNCRDCGTPAEAVTDARLGRGENSIRCLREAGPALEAGEKRGDLVVVAGDFNEPSCLDWTAEAVVAWGRTGPIEWPTTRTFLDAGMTDCYRAVYPDPVARPGWTWTPVLRDGAAEVHDRIDLIHFAGRGWRTARAEVIGEPGPLSDRAVAPWPSDHRAVRVVLEAAALP